MVSDLEVGNSGIRVVNLGDLSFALKEMLATPEVAWRPRYDRLFEQKLRFPTQDVLVTAGGATVLVDAGDYSKFAAEGGEYVDPDYHPPPGLVEQLEEMGVAAEDVSHVVITHAHYDHYAGVMASKEGDPVPAFPRARYYLGKEDWEWPELKQAVQDPKSIEAKTLGRLWQRGCLELVSGQTQLAPGVTVIPAPGESPGHQVLKVESGGEAAYCVGDLFHHKVEVENPEWMSPWCDPLTNLRSRKRLIESASSEDALVIPSHILPGKIERLGLGQTYQEL